VIDQPALRWALTALFAVTAALFAAAVGGERKAVNALHAVASAAMILMIWPVGMHISPLLYILVFTCAALYFAYLALFGNRLAHPVYHPAMMAAMAAMGLLMAPNMATPAMADTGSHMSHMAMPMASPAAPAMSHTVPWLTATTGTMAAGFGIATLWWFYLLVRGPQRPSADLLMALGMSVAFAAMAA
jgi:hypothetical protein